MSSRNSSGIKEWCGNDIASILRDRDGWAIREREGSMKIPRFRIVLLAAALVAPLCGAGCQPFSMGIFTPIPVPPWAYERMEQKYVFEKLDKRTVIMSPIRDGFPPPICEDPPDDAQVLRALDPVARGVYYIYEEFRDDIQIVTERIVDRIDPVRTYPLIGDA
jgi:hypothetical protein